MHIFLGLGSNLGDRQKNLVEAKDLLMKHDVLVMGQSEVRETKPLGGLDQPDYLNQVIECQVNAEPEDLLRICKLVEKEMGREVSVPSAGGMLQIGLGASGASQKPNEQRWQSRIIDIDILYYGDRTMNTPALTIPHVGCADRIFVLQGMCDLAPDFVDPALKKSMQQLRDAL